MSAGEPGLSAPDPLSDTGLALEQAGVIESPFVTPALPTDLCTGDIVTLIARFQVDGFEPRQVSGLDADWVGLMTFAKTFTAGIIGQSTTLFMSAGTQEGSRSYVATERICGRAGDGPEGCVTVQHGGLESDPGTWFGHIVPGTGTGGFAGWAGTARIVHDDQGAYFEITLA